MQVVYFGRCVPWMLIDYMGWFKQYKLQQVRLLLLKVSTPARRVRPLAACHELTERSSPSAGQDDVAQEAVGVHEGGPQDALLRRAAAGASSSSSSSLRAVTHLPRSIQIYLFHPLAVSAGMKTFEVPFPSFWKQMVPQVRTLSFPSSSAWRTLADALRTQIALFFFIEDTWHYFVHRLMHHRCVLVHCVA